MGWPSFEILSLLGLNFLLHSYFEQFLVYALVHYLNTSTMSICWRFNDKPAGYFCFIPLYPRLVTGPPTYRKDNSPPLHYHFETYLASNGFGRDQAFGLLSDGSGISGLSNTSSSREF